MYVYVQYAYQERGPDAQEVVVSHVLDAGNWAEVFLKSTPQPLDWENS